MIIIALMSYDGTNVWFSCATGNRFVFQIVVYLIFSVIFDVKFDGSFDKLNYNMCRVLTLTLTY